MHEPRVVKILFLLVKYILHHVYITKLKLKYYTIATVKNCSCVLLFLITLNHFSTLIDSVFDDLFAHITFCINSDLSFIPPIICIGYPPTHHAGQHSYPVLMTRRGGGRRLPPTPNKPSTLKLQPSNINFPKLNASPTRVLILHFQCGHSSFLHIDQFYLP